ncbi:MAG TPA: glutamate--tRNA ligase [Candidatus Limnocylindria bacterium]|nr:glutamate--tRNA ligase [Candidatus Limnocylindria bacterium]
MTVRVRFAPSPTGSLHIGSVRTTLYNYLFARQNKGTLVLRIEDTDQDRLVPGAIDSIYDGLEWMGITWDEGPREGGDDAPYVQSERLPMYQKAAQELVTKGAAYFCFCSKERLAALRAQQAARKEITRYDGLCRTIAPAEAAERAKNEPHVVRLRVPDEGVIALDDLVYGRIEWPIATIEDQVLLKSDGYPTYHLAVVVDDHVMGITHIFRGEDWLPSTPKHLLIFRAFGWDVPPIAHFPNVLGADNKKLAKRHGATKVEQFRADGYLPEAMINYLALIGWAPGTEDEIFSLDDLVARWRIDQVQKAGGKWDRARLDWFNGVWIRKLTLEALMERLAPYVPAEWDRGVLTRALPLIHERMATLVEARDQLAFLFTDDLAYDPALLVQENDRARSVRSLTRTASALRGLASFDAAAIKAAIEGVAAELGWKVKPVTLVIRAAVTGRRVGPPLYESLELLGRDRALARIARAEELLGEGPRDA